MAWGLNEVEVRRPPTADKCRRTLNEIATSLRYDIPMTKAIAEAVSVPVIASGGAGKLEHLYQAIVEAHADAVLVASIAHFGTYTIRQMKEYLAERGIAVNL